MPRTVDPLVDYAFKKLFGREENKNLLLHFLNAVIQPQPPLTELTLLDLHLGREHAKDKLSIVDVLATDADGRVCQVDLQLYLHQGLPQRATHNWASLYDRQLKSGQDYHELRPVYAVWILAQALFQGGPAHRRFRVRDDDGHVLTEDFELHTLELPKFDLSSSALDAKHAWVYFLREAGGWTELPAALDTPEMRQAMANMREIFEEDREWFIYRARMEDERVKRAMEYTRQKAEEDRLKAEAQLAAIQAQLEETQAKVEETQAQLEETQAKVEETQAQLEETQAKVEETQAKVEETQAEAETAKAEVETAKAEAETAKAEVETAKAEAETAKAEVETAKAEASALRAKLLALGVDPDL